ncbi:hypothetical protein Tco_1028767 [Tanacetum coccineum]|uniref:Uncharacterized protein n=1 Tax=Tanacetum coccineum TaxID=301880 RepID=A0ABQ5G1I0_9ASTR
MYQLMAVKITSFPEMECSGSIDRKDWVFPPNGDIRFHPGGTIEVANALSRTQAYRSLLFCRDTAKDVSDGYTYPNVDEGWFERYGKSKQSICTPVLLEASADMSDIYESHDGNPQANDWWMRRVANLTIKIKGVEGNQIMNVQD